MCIERRVTRQNWLTIARRWGESCDERVLDRRENAEARALVVVHPLDGMTTAQCEFTSGPRPSRAPFRASWLPLHSGARDPILGRLRWAEIAPEVAADAAERPLATTKRAIEGEIVELLALHATVALVAAAMLARRLPPTRQLETS